MIKAKTGEPSSMEYILETVRLRLRAIVHQDSSFIIQLLNSPGWVRYIGDRNVHTEEDAIRYIDEGPRRSYRNNGFGLYLVETKNNTTPIGICGLLRRDALQYPDIGFAFLPEYEGQGYAFEMAKATLQFARDILKIHSVFAVTLAENDKSRKLLQKLGFVYVREIRLASSSDPLQLYVNPLIPQYAFP